MTLTEAAAQLLGSLAAPFLDPASRTWWGALAVSAALTLALALLGKAPSKLRASWRDPSVKLDLQLLLGSQLLGLLKGSSGVGLAWLLATHLVRRMDAWAGTPTAPELSPTLLTLLYSATLFVAWDASRFAVHWALHRVPLLWRFHQIHHSATVLTPLTYHRVHPVESLLYQGRGALVTGVVAGLFYWVFRGQAQPLTWLGVPALGLGLNMLVGNLRHSHVWLPYPAWMERWLISPAQHQVHHSADPEHFDKNFGTWLSVWDRLTGSWLASDVPPTHFGLAQPNHSPSLLSAWFAPFAPLKTLPVLSAALLLLSGAAQAEDSYESSEEEAEETEPDESPGLRMIVKDKQGTPRVAGSAHELSEEDLEQFEYNDIERVLSAQVPGVTTRGEDGYGLRPNIGIRGANSERSAKVSLMEDGVLLAPAPYAAPAAYYFPMSTRMVGLEVFKGPAAIRYGPNTVGGAVNLLTRPVPLTPELRIDLAGGLRQTAKVHVYGGTSWDKGGFLIEGVHLRTAGFKSLPNGGPTGFDHSEAMAKLYWMPTPGQRLELKLGYTGETSNETYTGLSAQDYEKDPYARYAATSKGVMDFSRGQAELSWLASPGAWKVRTVAYGHGLDRYWTKLNGFEDGPGMYELVQNGGTGGEAALYMAVLRGESDSSAAERIEIGTRDRQYLATGLQSTARYIQVGEQLTHSIELGARVHQDQVWRYHTADFFDMRSGALVDSGETRLDQDSFAQARALALHAQDDVRIGDWHVLPGFRLETISSFKHDTGESAEPALRITPLPGLGVLHETTPWMSLFAGANRGFSPVAPGQPEEVRPETSWNYEGGLRFDQGATRLEVVGFFNDYENLTGQCSVSGSCVGEQIDQQFSAGEVWIWGAELGFGHSFLLPGNLSIPLEGSYTLTQSRFRSSFASEFPQFGNVSTGDALPYLPEHQAAGRVGLRGKRFSSALGLIYRSEMLDSAGDFESDLTVPSLFLVDASLNVQISPSTQLYLSGTNLLNNSAPTAWRPVGLRPSAPRQVMLGIKVHPLPQDRGQETQPGEQKESR